MITQPAEGAGLSRRQAEIAQLLVEGKSTREIAFALTLSPRTVETHIAAIYNKYGVSSRAELMLAVLGPGAQGAANPLLPADEPIKTNLPVRHGALVGRATDIATIVELLRANPLVTLTGAGGIGKTQAALAVGEALLGTFAGGVWLVELAALAHGSPIGEALARALSIEPSRDLPLIDALVAALQRKTLLIVDNCEHVIGEAAALADALLRRCAHLQILATSREPLRIAAEQTYRLPSLPVPAPEDSAMLRAAAGARYAAIELFTQRARAVDFSFALHDANTPVVAEICRRLDGIPLAIELAAARVKVLSVSALAAKIESHLRILAGGDRLSLPRHRTMHALIDWSYQLLAPAERRLFERIAVFAGGFELAQAIAVAGDETDGEFTIFNLLASLVDKSLLSVDVQSSEPRYSLLQSFALYAIEKLEVRGEMTSVRQRHANAYTILAEQLEEEYDLAPTQAWFSRVESEFANFTSALTWTLEARRDTILGQRLAAALRPVWIRAGKRGHWLQIARDLVDERTPRDVAARLDHAAASTAYATGDYQRVVALCRRLIPIFQELGDPVRAASAQSFAASSLLFLGRLDEGERLIAPALEVARSHGRWLLIAFLLRASCLLSNLRGNPSDGRRKLVEALAIYEQIDAPLHTATALGALAECEFQAGHIERALELATKCLNLQRPQRWQGIVHTLTNMAAYNVALNRWDRARAYAREALGWAEEFRDSAARALQHLAAIAVLSVSEASSSPALTRGALLLGYADACVKGVGLVREYTEQQGYDRVLSALRARVPADDLARLLAQGATLTAQEAIDLALSI